GYPWYDPYNQNLLKGDYPIWGQDVFLKLTAASETSVEGRSAPTAGGVSTAQPGTFDFFGNDHAVILDQKFALRADLQKGLTAFKPFDWALTLEGVGDVNYLGVFENGAVSPDVRDGTTRTTTDIQLEQGAVEVH